MPGAVIYGVLYEVDTTGGTEAYIPLDQTDNYTLQASDRDSWVDLGFNQANNLVPGMYMIAVGGYMHPTDTFGINVSGDAEVTMSMIYDDGSGCDLGSQTPPFWYWVQSTPMIRLNFGTFVINNINENLFKGSMLIYPNPSKGELFLDLNDVENDKYTISIKDILGKQVFLKEVYVNSTLHQKIDLTSFTKGTYIINIENSNNQVVKKIIVE